MLRSTPGEADPEKEPDIGLAREIDRYFDRLQIKLREITGLSFLVERTETSPCVLVAKTDPLTHRQHKALGALLTGNAFVDAMNGGDLALVKDVTFNGQTFAYEKGQAHPVIDAVAVEQELSALEHNGS